jgi:poly(A) polymerase
MTKKTISAQSLGINKQLVKHDAVYVIEKLHLHKFDGYIVGGGVRDLLLNKTPKDFDIVTNATPEQVKKIFKKNSIIIGRRFKIVHVIFDNINPEKMINNRPMNERHIIEISTYRSSKVNKKNLNERGRIIEDNNYGTQKEDAVRRDFTINALYYDPINEIVIDYNNGLKDIDKKLIRIIGNPKDRYTEDPVRMLRALRLSVKLGLEIEKSTFAPFSKMKHLLTHENKGRLYEEMLKILLSGSSALCINKLHEVNLPHNVFTLFDNLFFKSKPDTFALKALEKTDARLQETSDVSLVFILAGLMWNMVYTAWQKSLAAGTNTHQALLDAIYQTRDFANGIGVTKYTFSAMRDVWLLQLEFDMPSIKHLGHILSVPRFRQAWHLFSLRHDAGQVDPVMFIWWDRFINGDNEQRVSLQEELPTADESSISKIPKKRKRKKKVAAKLETDV